MASFAILCEKAGPKGCIIIIRKSHRTSKSFRRNDTEKDIKNLVDRHCRRAAGNRSFLFFKVNGSIGSDKIQLRLAHGQAGDSEIGGTITPPVGNVLFVGCSLAKQRLENVMKSLVPFFVAIFISLMPVTYIPALNEWLPTTLGLM